MEPEQRVAIRESVPDDKQPYHVIRHLEFCDDKTFPSEINFNPNLNAIIGSRASGKSALLAYLAHAVDPEKTVEAQLDAGQHHDPHLVGPGPGFTWDEVASMGRKVVWSSGDTGKGSIIYVPQNSLYSLSGRPEEVTRRIRPLLFRIYPEIKESYDSLMATLERNKSDIERQVNDWFEAVRQHDEQINRLKQMGDKISITNTRDALQAELKTAQAKSAMTPQEIDFFNEFRNQLTKIDFEIDNLKTDSKNAASVLGAGNLIESDPNHPLDSDSLNLSISVDSDLENLPSVLKGTIEEVIENSKRALLDRLSDVISSWFEKLEKDLVEIADERTLLIESNRELSRKAEGESESNRLMSQIRTQQELLDRITVEENNLILKSEKMEDIKSEINSLVLTNLSKMEEFCNKFKQRQRQADELIFEVECEFNQSDLFDVTGSFQLNRNSPYLLTTSGDPAKLIDVKKIQDDPGSFLQEATFGEIALKRSVSAVEFCKQVLTLNREVRYAAVFDSDRIGGFSPSTMTAGKQALFALILLLSESDTPWPLLIDQPEDDLDSRSIFDTIVPYLMDRKRERQIIMVTHDANLAIGADAEAIIVANRNSDSSPNPDSRVFDYLVGSLESDDRIVPDSGRILESKGIREHCCEILDGGLEAFAKRRQKYRV